MDTQSVAASYANALTDSVSISGKRGIGTAKTYSAANVRARIRGYQPRDIVGTIMQGDQEAILLKADLDAQGYPVPERGDRMVCGGITSVVQFCDANTRRVNGTVIAYVCQVRG